MTKYVACLLREKPRSRPANRCVAQSGRIVALVIQPAKTRAIRIYTGPPLCWKQASVVLDSNFVDPYKS